jgi:hypothetical protein
LSNKKLLRIWSCQIFHLPEEEELQPDGSWMSGGDGCIYDLQGRKVATKEQVTDGKWRERLSQGIYILNGRKFALSH